MCDFTDISAARELITRPGDQELGVCPDGCGTRSWLYKGTQPTLGSLLSLCERFDVSLVQLLTCEPSTVAALMRDAATPSPRVNRASARKRQHFDTDGARRSLECILAAEELPPPSMREVARRLGHDQRRLQHKLPDLHHRISARYLEYRSENSRSSA
jgi:hypothetical protein